MRWYYAPAHFKQFPNREHKCKSVLDGTWFDKDPKGNAVGIKIK